MIPILVGSQTGNGSYLAKLLTKSLENTCIYTLNDFDLLKINSYSFIIFIMSTHGDGQCPFNMSQLYNLLIKTKNKKIFSFDFAILGLGDSSYQKYNYCARICTEKLKELGAKCVLQELCDSQDPNGMYDGYNRFEKELNRIIQDYNNNFNTSIQDSNDIFNTSRQDSNDTYNIDITSKNQSISSNNTLEAKVISNIELTPENYDNKIYEIILEIPKAQFIPGNCISIVPENTIDLSKIFNFSAEKINFLKKNIDFNSTVHQPLFEILPSFTHIKSYKEKLLEISKDYDLYYEYVLVPRRNILEIINDFKLELSYDFLLELTPIYPRYFTCTLLKDNINRYSILYNIIRYKTYLSKERIGLCSEYLKNIPINTTISVEMIKSNLFFEEKNLLFFCTGTGITLPRSVVHLLKDKRIKIYYGFRYYEIDQLCKEEFNNNSSVEITYVSSREDKKYIMDVYKEDPVENIDEWLVFVSGNSRLNKSVEETLKEVHNKKVKFQSETW